MSMSPTQLKTLLTKGAVVSQNLLGAAAVCEAWYRAEPSLTTFVLRAILDDLISRGWDDKQGVPIAVYQPFQAGVLPPLLRLVDILIATPAAEPIAEADAIVVAYRGSLLATP